MPIIEPPKTVKEFEKVLLDILILQANPYADNSMLKTLKEKQRLVEAKIEELKS